MVQLNFNATQVAPNASLEALPSGTYDVIITNTVEKPTKDGQGSYIEFEMTVQGPDQQLRGRKVFDRLNIRNASQQAVDIAYGTLSAICHVCNRHHISDTAQLHGIPLKAVVSKVAREDKPGEFSNDVKGYKDAYGNDPGQQGQGGAPQGGQPGGMPQGYGGGMPQQQGYPQGQGQQPPAQQGYPPQNQQPQNGGGYPPQGQQPQNGYGNGQPAQGSAPSWAGGGQPDQSYTAGHQQGHGAPGHGGPNGAQPSQGEGHAYNDAAGLQGGTNGGGQPQQPPPQQQAPQGGQQQPQGGQPPAGAGDPPPWAQPQG